MKDAAEARRILLDGISRWGVALPSERIGDIGLLAGEVIANAVIHTGTPAAVSAIWTGTAVRVEVSDESLQMPVVKDQFGEAMTSGQGLNLVRALSNAWGVRADDSSGTKVVWFECGPRQEPSAGQPDATVAPPPERPHGAPRCRTPRAHALRPRTRHAGFHRRSGTAMVAAGRAIADLCGRSVDHTPPDRLATTEAEAAPDQLGPRREAVDRIPA
ncbi:ATP-binding protein [Kitasatospora sp. NPDC058032]|uniref:ATP-binding protein n=1 Tax=Kitasatospora sp. NPDC058032 TaxID=3346307 RepID=UPI0036DC18E3